MRRITLAMLYLLLLLPNPLPQRANPYQYNAIDLSPAPHYGRNAWMENKMALRAVQNALITLDECRVKEDDRL